MTDEGGYLVPEKYDVYGPRFDIVGRIWRRLAIISVSLYSFCYKHSVEVKRTAYPKQAILDFYEEHKEELNNV